MLSRGGGVTRKKGIAKSRKQWKRVIKKCG